MKNIISLAGLFAIGLFTSGSARADNLGYAVSYSGAFGTIDLNTGAFTPLGNIGQTLSGLAAANGSLFGASYEYQAGNGTLYKVNIATGVLTSVGAAAGFYYDDFGSTTSGLYAVSVGSPMQLYSINPSNGAATLIGPTGLSFGSYRCLSTNSTALYLANGTDLYNLNTSTGAASHVGSFGNAQMSTMLMEGGILYGTDVTSDTIDTINVNTGAATVGPAINTSSQIYGLAPDPLPTQHPPFFTGEVPLGSGVYYLQFTNGNIFGYYNYQFFPFLYHYDLGFEYFLDANDGRSGAYFFDYISGHWWYTSPIFPFPYLYDFTLGTIVYYYPNPSAAGHYTANPRYFYDFATHMIITM